MDNTVIIVVLPSNQGVEEYKYLPSTLNNYVPPYCRGCRNHPSNGGSGICCCSLGGYQVTC